MSTSPWKNSRALLSGSTAARPVSEQSPRAAEARYSGIDPKGELTQYSQEPGYVVAVASRCLIHVCVDRTTSTTTE